MDNMAFQDGIRISLHRVLTHVARKPHLYFKDGYWRVTPYNGRVKDSPMWTKAHKFVNWKNHTQAVVNRGLILCK